MMRTPLAMESDRGQAEGWANCVLVTPSLICADLKDFGRQAKAFRGLGMKFMHADIIDGRFSPDTPLTFDMLDGMPAAGLPLDFHIMAVDCEPLVRKALEYDACQVCFHVETTLHVDRLLNIIRARGVRCGLALTPTTPPCVLEYAAELCDFVLLMLINPGYASAEGERQVGYAVRKVRDCRRFLDERGRRIPIEVDGRISFESIPDLVAAGADILVGGTTSLFRKGRPMEENHKLIEQAVRDGLKRRI